jgi:hypothetical protein
MGTPEQQAFRAWSVHAAGCRVCRQDESRCRVGQRLGRVWRETRRRSPRPVGSGDHLEPPPHGGLIVCWLNHSKE